MSDPDRTDKMLLRTQPNVLDYRRARGEPLPWPAPPYYVFTEEAPHGGESCLLHFSDGEKAMGTLEAFSPDAEVVRFRAASAASAKSVPFSSLISARLLRAVHVRRERLAIDGAVFLPSDRQSFSAKLSDGTTLEGETVGHVNALCGLFLFPPEADGKVGRVFLPKAATREVRIGKPIGEMLVDEKAASRETVSEALDKQKQLRARKLGEYLTANEIVSQDELATALRRQRAQPVQKLGETLVELGFLTRQELQEALAIEARDRSMPLGQILADMGVIDGELVHSVMARKLGVPYVNLRKFRPTAEALKRIPPAVAARYGVLPLAEVDNALVVAVDDPTHMERMEEVRFAAGTKLLPVMAPAPEIKEALQSAYGVERDFQAAMHRAEADVNIEQLTLRLSSEAAADEAAEQQSAQIDSTLVKLVNKIIMDAVEQKASDIHIEANPGGRNVRVRLRKDGALVNYLEIPSRFRGAVISRLKVMSQLDIAERRKPQDGKIAFRRFGPLDVELRIATIPTANGLEDVVMRVLAAATPKPIEELGFAAATLAAVRRLIARPHGMFLVCGPTGSGKTTTLHSLLAAINSGEKKIWTAEDPIEITQPALRQVQVNAKIGWTFAAAMRSFMRADPDVIMVGEMRDAETAKIGVEASLTGHLVLSTLHTNSAPESVVRLLDLGMDPFNFADALLGVLAQRLVRTLCPHCRARHEPSARELADLAAEYCVDTDLDRDAVLAKWRQQPMTLYGPKGCKECDRTGYKGRMAVYELMVADATVKRLVQTRAPVSEIAASALAAGMRTLKQDGIEKVLRGLTDMTQVRAL